MAQPKKKPQVKTITQKANPVGSQKKSPFKTKKSTVATKQADNIITPPAIVAEAVDAFRNAVDQAKFHEGEATVHKNTVMEFAAQEFSRRLYHGDTQGFKIQGNEFLAMYVVQDAGAGLSEEDVDQFRERWGDEAAQDLIVRDFASIRFNESILETHYDEVVAALQTLPEEILDHLFRPMALKVRKGALERVRKFAKNKEELQEMMRDLKFRHYVR